MLLTVPKLNTVFTIKKIKTVQVGEEKEVLYIQSHKLQASDISDLTQIQGIHKRIVRVQKLTRNLFLTLHGHNVHRQRRQLSKFLMRYQQFASHAYCGAAEPVSKMASQQENAFCMLRFEVSRSVITVQREFRAARFRKDASYMVRLF